MVSDEYLTGEKRKKIVCEIQNSRLISEIEIMTQSAYPSYHTRQKKLSLPIVTNTWFGSIEYRAGYPNIDIVVDKN